MGESEDGVRRWLLDECPGLVEVTAFNPISGRSRKLGPNELREVLSLLLDFEAAPSAPGLAERCTDMGMDPIWFDSHSRASRPMFVLRAGEREKVGYCLRELLDAAREEARRAAGLDVAAAQTLGRPRDKMVYIVDDDDSIRDLLAFAMGREGFRTDVFANGAEVVQKIRNTLPTAPDLMLLDLMMPMRGGYDVIRDLQDSDFPKIPIIVVTGRNIDRAAVAELRAESNVVDFLAKPLNPKTLIMSAHQLLKTVPAKRG